MHRSTLANSNNFHFILFFYCNYFGEKLHSGKKDMRKTSKKITEMGINLEFDGNPRNSSQVMITGLMRSLKFIKIFI